MLPYGSGTVSANGGHWAEHVGENSLITNLKVLALSILVILSNVIGNCLLNMGVKAGRLVSWASVLRLVLSPPLVAGVLLLIAWMLLRMALLSTTPMTVVLPLTAGVAYVLTGGIGQFWFAEKVPATYNYGLILIVAGVLLVGTSTYSPGSQRRDSDAESQTSGSTANCQI
jgi:multidrug transporter EmrE-like cation transporter